MTKYGHFIYIGGNSGRRDGRAFSGECQSSSRSLAADGCRGLVMLDPWGESRDGSMGERVARAVCPITAAITGVCE